MILKNSILLVNIFSKLYSRSLTNFYTFQWMLFLMDKSNLTIQGEGKQENIQKITPFMWFDKQADEAAKFYVSIFKNSKIGEVTKYGKEGYEFHKMEEGTVMTVNFDIEGQKFVALNGGPMFKFNEAISFQVLCETQEEVDHYWEKLSEGGDVKAQQCGWLKDKYGVSWQIVPTILSKMIKDEDTKKSQRVIKAMLQMHKLDIKTLYEAYEET
jgi:predicted 3-demethylubiquinone-9 3-methyltransferase (glyoxalase superfamily)